MFNLLLYKYAAVNSDLNERTSMFVSDPSVKDIEGASRITNNITYGKGAAYQNQLQKIIGEKKYKKGI